jgi:phenylpyruvate tautomerase PptA (4-oxalocrotonate tautomerase family)
MEVFGLPENKRFHRYILLDEAEFLYPSDRTPGYTIIELSIFLGRTVETKKALIRAIFLKAEQYAGIDPHDLEITIFETPMSNWGIRGVPGDELVLNYNVET